MTSLKVILIILGVTILYLALLRIIRKLYHFPAPAFIGRFLDSNVRRWLQPPDKIIERSGIKPGMTVLDLGCGSGMLAVTEFPPDPDYPLRSTTIRLCQREDFILDDNSGNLWNYTVRFKKPSSG